MTDNNHPMLPTQDQLTEWDSERFDEGKNFDAMMIKAFQAGADQELEACVEWLGESPVIWCGDPEEHPGSYLREARRPKPQSLKEEALEALKHAEEGWRPIPADCEIIRRALEALPD